MRLPDNAAKSGLRKSLILCLGIAVAACGRGSETGWALGNAAPLQEAASSGTGPAADYPQVLGEPYTIDGQTFVPEDVLSYDSVGYAVIDPDLKTGIFAAHKTLPLPSYVEVTALDTGTTILVRVTDRGPMKASHLVALSPEAAGQLALDEGDAVRVRRVNPPEYERAMLRAGEQVPVRLEVPKSLLAVLRQKLPASGSASLRSTTAENASARSATLPPTANRASAATAPVQASAADTESPPAAIARTFDAAFSNRREASESYPLPPLRSASSDTPDRNSAAGQTLPSTYSLPGNRTAAIRQDAQEAGTSQDRAQGAFVIQAAAFASKSNADRAASSLDGFVAKSGRYYRVRTGPYPTRGQAEAALAKVRAAGYSDAKVFTAG